MSARSVCVVHGAVLIGALAACSTGRAHLADPASAPRAEWTTSSMQASQEALAGRFAAADKLLADYTVRFPATPEAAESMFWRALYKLDPSNPGAVPHDAVVLLDGYLASGTTAHRAEAQSLRRISSALEARAATPAPAKVEIAKVDEKARDEEIQRLKDELAKANAELERIKRRLAQPSKP